MAEVTSASVSRTDWQESRPNQFRNLCTAGDGTTGRGNVAHPFERETFAGRPAAHDRTAPSTLHGKSSHESTGSFLVLRLDPKIDPGLVFVRPFDKDVVSDVFEIDVDDTRSVAGLGLDVIVQFAEIIDRVNLKSRQ